MQPANNMNPLFRHILPGIDIAYILAGESAKDTLESISGRTCSSYPKENLTSLKEYFQPDIAGFMNENYKNRY